MLHSRRIKYINNLECSGVEGASFSIVGGLNILITDTLGYSGAEGTSCSIVGGLGILMT
jgi:hypothetical protein